MSERTEPIVTFGCGATSSACPDFAQIPLRSLIALANRFELGEKKHGRGQWKKGLSDKEFVLARLNHVIYHAYKLIDKIETDSDFSTDDDAGAIMWGGAFLIEAVNAIQASRNEEPFVEGYFPLKNVGLGEST